MHLWLIPSELLFFRTNSHLQPRPTALPPEDRAWAMIGEWMVDQRTYILSMMYVN